ncbi:hypothetical protein Y032_0022g553 [Ancylostoma ceylanicum]|uniref:Glycosyl-hydrolase family 116 N-terminal domain-containing protein n=1 Tax=Ancylostoma ceylanicum TaxID=53326 RepID=A0A016UZ54_9BILA|nr:hypothetical protein Y032_0022g553 [Ancylostoma ceylanicum]
MMGGKVAAVAFEWCDDAKLVDNDFLVERRELTFVCLPVLCLKASGNSASVGSRFTLMCKAERSSSARRRAKMAAEDQLNNLDVQFEQARLPPELTGPGWKARGDRTPTDKRVPFNRPTAKQIFDALPFVRRYFFYWMRYTFDKEKLFINTFQPLKHKPFYGVPCGGIGCGAMGRDFRGGFCKFSLRPGLVEHKVDVIPANQFILSVRRDNCCVYQKVLCAADVVLNGQQLSAWDFSFPKKDLHYSV